MQRFEERLRAVADELAAERVRAKVRFPMPPIGTPKSTVQYSTLYFSAAYRNALRSRQLLEAAKPAQGRGSQTAGPRAEPAQLAQGPSPR